MANQYFTASDKIARHSLARAEQIISEFAAIELGFERLPEREALDQGRITYLLATGPANTYAASYPGTPTAYAEGMHVALKLPVANTGAATLNLNGIGPRAILRVDGNNVVAGDLGGLIEARYNGTAFVLITAARGDLVTASESAASAAIQASAAAASASAAASSATGAAASATAASSSATASDTARGLSETARTAAQTARTGAETAQTGAQTARTGAETAQTGAQTARTGAETARTGAQTAESNANTSKDAAAASATAAASSQTGAASSASSASSSASAAASSATAASGSASSAAASASSISGLLPNVNATVNASDEELNRIVGLTSSVQSQIDGKSATGHVHTIADTTGLQAALDAKLGVNATAVNATKVLNKDLTAQGTADTVALRDGSGDLVARLLRTSFANETSIATTAAVHMRVNTTTDNYSRAVGPAAFVAWLNAQTGVDSDTLGGLAAASFLRADADTKLTTATPTLGFLDTFDTTAGRILMNAGSLNIQAGQIGTGETATGGIIRFAGYQGVDLADFTVRHSGLNRKIWHEGNDGAASGLDADLLDGLQGTSFLRADAANIYLPLTNSEISAVTVEGRLYFDSSAGIYVQANNSLYAGPAALWSRGNVTQGLGMVITYDAEMRPTLAIDEQTYFLRHNTGGVALNVGDVIAGSNLRTVGIHIITGAATNQTASTSGGVAVAGTYQCTGSCPAETGRFSATTFKRIA